MTHCIGGYLLTKLLQINPPMPTLSDTYFSVLTGTEVQASAPGTIARGMIIH